MDVINIILADDSELWRKRLVADLMPFNIACIGEAANGRELLELMKTRRPDVILLDLEMPLMSGDEAMHLLRDLYPGIKVIIMSIHDAEELILDYIASGAKGYIPKDAVTIELLVHAIRRVNASDTYVYRPEAKRLTFTPRQLEIISMLCDGLTNKEIAQKIGITQWGVEKQRQKIYEKTGSKNAVDFYKYAFRQGLDFLNGPGKEKPEKLG